MNGLDDMDVLDDWKTVSLAQCYRLKSPQDPTQLLVSQIIRLTTYSVLIRPAATDYEDLFGISAVMAGIKKKDLQLIKAG